MSNGKYLKNNKSKKSTSNKKSPFQSKSGNQKNNAAKSSTGSAAKTTKYNSKSYTYNASTANKIHTTSNAKKTINCADQKNTQKANKKDTVVYDAPKRINSKQSAEKTNSRINLSDSVSQKQKVKKCRIDMTDWTKEEEISIMMAERDGTITGIIMLLVMTMLFSVYMVVSNIFPALGPEAVNSRVADVIIGLICGMTSGCFA